ncbi:aminoacyl-tRNA hydrolase [bacterium]|nr:aminoacyl-tRNA hydrolase [bacterium]
MISVTDGITLSENEIRLEFIRASGPGGQNVNKVATSVQLRFKVVESASLPQAVKKRLTRMAGKKMSSEGELIITAKRFRTQERNRQDAITRLVALIRKAAKPPKPRIKTKPSAAAKERRLKEKRQRSQIKQNRRSDPLSDD